MEHLYRVQFTRRPQEFRATRSLVISLALLFQPVLRDRYNVIKIDCALGTLVSLRTPAKKS